jgi:hypothetical protein
MAFGEIRRVKRKTIAAAQRDAARNFTAAVSGVGRGASARRASVKIEVRRVHGTARSLTRMGGSYVAKACLGAKRCVHKKGTTPTRAIKAALSALSSALK